MKKKIKIKKINFLYIIFMAMLWPVVERLVIILTSSDGRAWLLVMFAYESWYIFSFPLIYVINRRIGIKGGFVTYWRLIGSFATVWIDATNGELAYLSVLNPFKIHYVPLKYVNGAYLEVNYEKDREYICSIICCFYIQGKKYRFCVDSSTAYYKIKAETRGKEFIAAAQKLVDILNRDW